MVNRQSSRGYTIIELVLVFVVISIVGVVLTLNAMDVVRSNAERAADEHATRVLLAQESFARRHGAFTGYPADLGRFDTFDVVTGTSAAPQEVSIALGEAGTLGVAVRRNDDVCVMWRAADPAAGGGTQQLDAPRSAVCEGREALPDGEAVDLVAAETSSTGS